MSSDTLKYVKGIASAVVLLVLVLTVRGWWRDYRDASSTMASTETSETVSAESTDSPSAEEGEAKPGKEAPEEAKPSSAAAAGTVVVLIDGLNFRTKPEADATPIRGLREGEKLTLLSERSGWYEVRSADGSKGWVSSNPNYTELKRR